MRRTLWISIFFSAILIAPGLMAQAPPWPNGCTVLLPIWVQQGIDGIFFGSCDRHDRCWGQCNGPSGPYPAYGYKAQCDLAFLADMQAACVATSLVVVFPLGDIGSARDFVETCSTIAGTFYAAIATPVVNGVFDKSQCNRGCNRDACTRSNRPFPDLCGKGQCYTNPTNPPVSTCTLVNCNSPSVCSDWRRWCCDDCGRPPEHPQCGDPSLTESPEPEEIEDTDPEGD